MTTHKEKPGYPDEAICIDCQKFYECHIRENAEKNGNYVYECSDWQEDKGLHFQVK